MIPRKREVRLFLHLTRDCNLRCTYCYAGEKTRAEMSLEVGRKAIDLFLPRAWHMSLQFFGGEPLLRLETMQALHAHTEAQKKVHNTHLSYAVVTNGTLFTPEVAEFCTQGEVDISLSLDGDKVSQDSARLLTSGKGSFDQLDANVDRMFDTGRLVHVVSVIHAGNVGRYAASLAWLLERGFRSIATSADLSNAQFADCMPVLDEQLAIAADLYLDYKRRGEPVYVDLFDDQRSIQHRHRCSFGRDDFAISPEGVIYPCCCFVDHDAMPLGTVDDGLHPAKMEGLLADGAALDAHQLVEHASCPPDSACHQACGCTNVVATGSVRRPPEVSCQFGAVVHRHRARVLDTLGLTLSVRR